MTARVAVLLPGVILLASLAPLPASPDTLARHKPGPVTIRGVARHVSRSGFSLVTRTQGTLTVQLSAATTVTQKGVKGRVRLAEGAHVGVRGFRQGQTLRAIRVRVYPVKPKPYSIRGHVAQTGGGVIVVTAGGSRPAVRLNGSTVIHVGSRLGTARDIRVGDNVQVRVVRSGGGITALSVHIYRRKPVQRHVQVVGTVVQVGQGTVWVRSGPNTVRVRVGNGASIYLGNGPASVRSLHPGQTVHVYACCAGRSLLVATSVHIRKTKPVRHVSLLQGTVLSLGGSQLRLSTSGGTLLIHLGGNTAYQLGLHPISASGVRVGDQVSVRAYRSGATWIAERVHIYLAGRRPHTVTGTVTYVGSGYVSVRAQGGTYTVRPGRGTRISLGGHGVQLGALHPGDRIHAVGRLSGRSLTASSIAARRLPAKLRTLRGTVVAVSGATLIIADSAGTRRRIAVPGGASVRLNGKRVAVTGLFAGLRVSVRARKPGSTFIASTVTASAASRTVKGVIARLGRQTLTVSSTGGRQVTVAVPPTAQIQDGSRRILPSSLHVGGRVEVKGLAVPGGVRAQHVTVLHPLLDVAGSYVATSGGPTLRTSGGDSLRLRFTAATSVSTGSEAVSLQASQIPNGARLHIHGTVQSDGSVLVTSVTVRLASVALRAQVASMSGSTWTVRAAGSEVSVRLSERTAVVQGLHSMNARDVVVGDDVTVYGYRLGTTLVVARKVAVHRKLVGVDGTVASMTSNGFILATASGNTTVITSGSTVVTGTVSPGETVHVTGYRRGDGSVLATRVRVKTKRKKP